jgi:hypothetical protein
MAYLRSFSSGVLANILIEHGLLVRRQQTNAGKGSYVWTLQRDHMTTSTLRHRSVAQAPGTRRRTETRQAGLLCDAGSLPEFAQTLQRIARGHASKFQDGFLGPTHTALANPRQLEVMSSSTHRQPRVRLTW